MINPIIIAIDGVSGSGKGTLAKKLAEHYKVGFLPTGNIYRYLAKQMLQEHVHYDDKVAIKKIVQNIKLDDLFSLELNTDVLAAEASKIAKLQSIRSELNDFQRLWVKTQKLAIIEGRDIGTVICPEADIKIFLTADLATRAKRRTTDLNNLGINTTYEQVYVDLEARDLGDTSRTNAPLKKADDAMVLDSAKLTIDQMLLETTKLIDQLL